MRSLLAVLFALPLAACGGGADVASVDRPAAGQPDRDWFFYSCESAVRLSCSTQRPDLSQRYFGSDTGGGSLCDITGDDVETYRLTWSRTFKNPILSQVQRRGGAYTWRAVRDGAVEGYGGPESGVIQEDRSGTLSSDEWGRITAAVDSASFWSLPDEPAWGHAKWAGDGAAWLLEGRRGDEYVGADCWTISDDVAVRVRTVGIVLLDLTEMLPESRADIY